jgi:hypothetical protein
MTMTSRMDEPIAPCFFCGADPAPFLYTTPVCPACAKQSAVTFDVRDGHIGLALVHADGRRHWLSWSDSDSPSLREHYANQQIRRIERHAVIAAGRASEEDPEFMARIGDYIAQVGWSPTVERALRHQRESGESDAAVAEAERLLGLRQD